jgi:hypothetical protein
MNEHIISTPSSCAVLPHRYDVCALSFSPESNSAHITAAVQLKSRQRSCGSGRCLCCCSAPVEANSKQHPVADKTLLVQEGGLSSFQDLAWGSLSGIPAGARVVQAAEQEEPLLTGEGGDTPWTT